MTSPVSPSRPRRRALWAAGCAVAALALSPAVASADSIVYVKDANVWLAGGDGGGQYQVTSDGTVDQPYRSPSQADDGTIAVSFGDEILRMRQNGEVLDRLDPPALMNSVSHAMDGVPVEVAMSPDGTKIAYTFTGYECPVGASCGARSATGIIPSDRSASTPEYGTSYFRNPSWVTNSRILNSGGYGSHINIQDLGTEPYNWITDDETDLGNAEVNPQGTRLVAVRGYGDDTHIVWYDVNGDVRSGPKPRAPDARCVGYAVGLDDPMWSPDGEQVAWTEPDGIWVKRDAGTCASPQPVLVLPGAAQGDWGPADVDPGPRVQPPLTPETTDEQGPQGGPAQQPTVTVPARLSLGLKAASGAKPRVSAKKVKIKLTCPGGCRYEARLTLDAKTAKRLGLSRMVARTSGRAKAGSTTVTLKLSGREARRLKTLGKRSSALKLSVSATGDAGSGRRSMVVAPR